MIFFEIHIRQQNDFLFCNRGLRWRTGFDWNNKRTIWAKEPRWREKEWLTVVGSNNNRLPLLPPPPHSLGSLGSLGRGRGYGESRLHHCFTKESVDADGSLNNWPRRCEDCKGGEKTKTSAHSWSREKTSSLFSSENPAISHRKSPPC